MVYGLGIDGGGSKTVCLLIDDRYQVLGRGEAGPSNYQSIGLLAATMAIKNAISQAVSYHQPGICIGSLGLGLAGVGRPEDVEIVRELVQQIQSNEQLQINWNIAPENFFIGGDSLIALVGGLGHDVGIVAMAGTGSQVFGRNHHGKIKRVGGWGYILGDEGGGYDIAVRGLRAVMRSFDGRLPPTRLTQELLNELGLKSPERLIEAVYRRGLGVRDMAALSTIIDRVAAEGDPVAETIITDVAQELVLATQVAIADLFNPGDFCEIVTVGGIWRGWSNLRSEFITGINAIAPQAEIVWPRHEPALGAALLAMKFK